MIRTRFAPSPTGYVHIGSLRTALFGFLLSRHETGGVNILRIEDTDQKRLVENAVENMVEVMDAVGIKFDEGFYWDKDSKSVKQKGSFGPYIQSERLDIYKKYIQTLLDNGSAYYCFCSEERLTELRTEQIALKKPPMYDRLCRNLTKDEAKDKMAEFVAVNKVPVIRQALPLEGKMTIEDVVHGSVVYDLSLLDDQILMKSDGFPTYNFANVIDDHLMEITHVIRGEEFIPSTPKYILLYKAFGWSWPAYVHIPLILNTDKSKLSKRQGDVSVEDFLNKGYLPEALVNFVAFLGWNPKTEQEIFSMEELIQQFDLAKINKAGAVFDVNKLDWMNGKYIREVDDKELTAKLIPYWAKAGWISPVIPDKRGSASAIRDPGLEDQSMDPSLPAVAQGSSLVETGMTEKNEAKIQNRNFILPHLDNKQVSFDYLVEITKVEKERLKKLSDITESTDFYFKRPELNKEILAWKKSTLEDAMQKLAELKEFFGTLTEEAFLRYNIEKSLQDFIAEKGYDNGSVLWPLRVALTGLSKSTGPFDVISIIAQGLGKEEVIKRL